jgi:hypothetical protein
MNKDCSACSKSLGQDTFSKTQWGKGASRRCKECTGQGQARQGQGDRPPAKKRKKAREQICASCKETLNTVKFACKYSCLCVPCEKEARAKEKIAAAKKEQARIEWQKTREAKGLIIDWPLVFNHEEASPDFHKFALSYQGHRSPLSYKENFEFIEKFADAYSVEHYGKLAIDNDLDVVHAKRMYETFSTSNAESINFLLKKELDPADVNGTFDIYGYFSDNFMSNSCSARFAAGVLELNTVSGTCKHPQPFATGGNTSHNCDDNCPTIVKKDLEGTMTVPSLAAANQDFPGETYGSVVPAGTTSPTVSFEGRILQVGEKWWGWESGGGYGGFGDDSPAPRPARPGACSPHILDQPGDNRDAYVRRLPSAAVEIYVTEDCKDLCCTREEQIGLIRVFDKPFALPLLSMSEKAEIYGPSHYPRSFLCDGPAKKSEAPSLSDHAASDPVSRFQRQIECFHRTLCLCKAASGLPAALAVLQVQDMVFRAIVLAPLAILPGDIYFTMQWAPPCSHTGQGCTTSFFARPRHPSPATASAISAARSMIPSTSMFAERYDPELLGCSGAAVAATVKPKIAAFNAKLEEEMAQKFLLTLAVPVAGVMWEYENSDEGPARGATVISVEEQSEAGKLGLAPGDRLLSIGNGGSEYCSRPEETTAVELQHKLQRKGPKLGYTVNSGGSWLSDTVCLFLQRPKENGVAPE